MSELRVLVADSQRAFAQIVAARLDEVADITMVGIGNSHSAVEEILRVSEVDVLVVDAALDGEGCLPLVSMARQRAGGLRVVVLLSDDDPSRAVEVLAAGASALVSKGATFDELLAAIRGTARGETWVPPRLLTGVLDELLHPPRANRSQQAVDQLTRREREVLECLVGGMSRTAIAQDLFLSTHTVRTHMRNLLSKLEAHSTLEAVAMAREAGINGVT